MVVYLRLSGWPAAYETRRSTGANLHPSATPLDVTDVPYGQVWAAFFNAAGACVGLATTVMDASKNLVPVPVTYVTPIAVALQARSGKRGGGGEGGGDFVS